MIVGVSGGMDSVALLSVLEKLRGVYRTMLVAAHLNHGLRGEEAERDAEFVRDLSRRWGIPCECQSVDIRKLKKKGMTLQEAGREARFSFFGSLVEKYGAQKVALGQTADDQAETMVMRFIRGAALIGLKGIPPVRDGWIIHPLIEVTRLEIEAYLDQEGLSHVEDSSNRKDAYLRNRVRNHLIPVLHAYNPNLKETLGRMGRILLSEEDYMRGQTLEALGRMSRQDGDEVRVDLTLFRDLHPALQFRLLKETIGSVRRFAGKRLRAAHLLSLAELAMARRPHGMIHLPGGVTARRTYDVLEIGVGERPSPPVFDHPAACPGATYLREVGKRLVTSILDRWDVEEASSDRVFLDCDKIQAPLRVRSYRPGDRFRPLGMRGTRKIKDCFIDWKIPMEKRARTPLVTCRDAILWVVGHRISQDFRVTPETKRVICMEIQDL